MQSEKMQDERLKAFKALVDESVKGIKDGVMVQVNQVEHIVQHCEQKVARCETAAAIIIAVKEVYDPQVEKI